jgi:hypothetical protein
MKMQNVECKMTNNGTMQKSNIKMQNDKAKIKIEECSVRRIGVYDFAF